MIFLLAGLPIFPEKSFVEDPYTDWDLDGYTLDDCDDSNANAYPNAPEVCDGIDNDCDGFTDEDDAKALGDCLGDDQQKISPKPWRYIRERERRVLSLCMVMTFQS